MSDLSRHEYSITHQSGTVVQCSDGGYAVAYGSPKILRDITKGVFRSLREVSEWLNNSDSIFLVVGYKEHDLYVMQSLYRCRHCFFTTDSNGRLRVSTNIASLNPTSELNPDYIIDYLSQTTSFGFNTAFKDIYSIPPGTINVFNCRTGNLRTSTFSIPDTSNRDPIDVIGSAIDDLGYDLPIEVFFTSGIDSNAITAALTRRNVRPDLTHTIDSALLGEDEYSDTCECAKAFVLGVRAEQDRIDADGRFVGYFGGFVNSPDEIPALGETEIRDAKHGKMQIVGHGGDHVFCQNPPLETPIDELKLLKPRKALKTALDLCALKGITLSNLLKHNSRRRPRFSNLLDPSFHSGFSDNHPLLKTTNISRSKEIHIKSILQGLDTTSTLGKDGVVLSPMLLRPVVGYTYHRSVSDLFTRDWDRIDLRKGIWKASQSPAAWGTRKRGSSRQIFKILSRNESRLSNFILQGWLASTGILNVEAVRQAIEINCHLRLDESIGLIIRAYMLEAFIQNVLRKGPGTATATLNDYN